MRRPTLSCFVWIYTHTVMIVSQKISRDLFDFLNNTYWVSLFQRNSGQGFPVSPKHSFTLPSQPLLTDGMTDRDSNTLTTRGLEEPFFQLSCCVSFLFWQEIGFGFTYSLCTQSTIQFWCCVSFFYLAGNSFWYIRTQCTIQL